MSRHARAAVVCTLIAATILSMIPEVSRSREPAVRQPLRVMRGPSPALSLDAGVSRPSALHSTVPPDTTWLGYWTFDAGVGECTPEGWTTVDITQDRIFTHVDDFAGLGGGTYGYLVPLEGSQSMWCGARPDPFDTELCLYAALPGYGNSWDQRFTTVACLATTGDVFVDYVIAWDSEPGYDYTTLEYDRCDDNWFYLAGGDNVWDGDGTGFYSNIIPDAAVDDSLRIRFRFTSDGAFSDQDGFHPSDGGFIVDSLTVRDATGSVLPTELFETEAVGAQITASGNWEATAKPGYGDFAALFSGNAVLQEDPCVSNLSCFWAFFSGSTADYSCGGHPEQPAVPYENERGQYIVNQIWSPIVPITGTGSRFEIGFDNYGVDIDPLITWMWEVRAFVNGCPEKWYDTSLLFLGTADRWESFTFAVDDAIPPGATEVQLSLGVFDACSFYCGQFGSGQCHAAAPFFDNVWIRRIDSNGPEWSVSDRRIFHDNFPADGTTTGTVRADMTLDRGNVTVYHGDSTWVDVWDAEDGLAVDPHTGFGPAAYLWVGVWPQGQPGKTGAALTSDSFRWPVVDSLTHDGDTWYAVRLDTSFSLSFREFPNGFCVDLNDNLFTPGDVVRFAFGAESSVGNETYYSLFTGTTDDMTAVLDNPMEFSCLPSPNADILYVDNFDGLGAQPFFDTAFEILGLTGEVDRYDIRAPLNNFENGLASRVVDPVVQLASHYHTIIWNSGNKDNSTLKDATTGDDDKLDDAAVLKTFLDNLEQPGGIYLSGDHLATDWADLVSAGAVNLRSTYMNFSVLSDDHFAFGFETSPLVVGADGGCFDHLTRPDTVVAFGGCPDVSRFDVLQATGTSSAEALYNGTAHAVIAQQTTNPQAVDVGVILSAFSFHAIRDHSPLGVPARAEHLGDILTWLGGIAPSPTAVDGPGYRTSLAQNYPNPFNPATTIAFTVRERAPVTLRVYNVAGQRVRTLVDDTRAPGAVHTIAWDGRNDAGQSVASGVYFYRLVTHELTLTRKMVLLK